MADGSDTPILPLRGVRVIDFSMQYAGPSAGAVLAALGADVIKIESARRPDITRAVRRPRGTVRNDDPADPRNTRHFHVLNHNKRSVTLNLQHDAGRAIARKLIGVADVAIQATRPGVMEKLGLGYTDISAVRPDIILLSISGSGQAGPESRYAGYAPLFAALGGVTGLTGYNSTMPAEWLAITDMRVGAAAATACLAALIQRKMTGQGAWLDLSGAEVMSTLIGDSIVGFSGGASPVARGNDDSSMAPHGCFATAEPDLWMTLAIGSDGEWRTFVEVAGLTSLADDARFADGFRRWKNREFLSELIRKWALTGNPRIVVDLLAKAGVGAGLCYRMDEALADPHLEARNALRRIHSGGLEQITVAALPWRFDDEAESLPITPGGAMGGQNEAIYCGLLGLTSAEYEALARDGAFT